jgi:hypothetical protein
MRAVSSRCVHAWPQLSWQLTTQYMLRHYEMEGTGPDGWANSPVGLTRVRFLEAAMPFTPHQIP